MYTERCGMEYIIVGLGNPGLEYRDTRHNAGRMVVERFALSHGVSDWRTDAKLRARVASVAVETGDTVRLILPENFMNNSGGAVAPLITSEKKAARLIVVHDDIDLPLGTIRIAFDRGAGGHRGVLSIERAIKTRAFVRLRLGVVPTTPTGKLKKPHEAEAVHAFILSAFTKRDMLVFEEMSLRATHALKTVIDEGYEQAQCLFNSVAVDTKKDPRA